MIIILDRAKLNPVKEIMPVQQGEGKVDPDILRCKQDVLRARGPDARENGRQAEQAPSQPTSLMAAVVQANKASGQSRQQSNIPKFDLANQILAEHRRVSAIKRRKPGEKAGQVGPGRHVADRSGAHLAGVQPQCPAIISEIVARDIRRLCAAEIA